MFLGPDLDLDQPETFIESKIHYSKKINTVEHLLDNNGALAHAIVQHALDFYNISMGELEAFITATQDDPTGDSKTHVLQALKHFVRDWSTAGRHERTPTFPCILSALTHHFPAELRSAPGTSPIRAALPGAGLARLAHDMAALGGFDVTANEQSAHMAVAYRYLTTLHAPGAASFHPFLDWWSHQATTADLVRQVAFPDAPPAAPVLFVEGDFAAVLQQGSFDVVVTLFFIDTARNLAACLESVGRLLRPGGIWINTGPLLYGTNPLLQLSLDEVVRLAEGLGFEFLEAGGPECGEVTVEGLRVRGREVPYGFDERGLARNAYSAQHWVARKR
ncbi:hypothetical protein SLS56_004948 [Neofusicoccum ribis]|uniref:Uncharacterized protein n=1 Tax=Neofusicoccum ribis TaxID=45134 RepID=A0ABR3SV21_9PEZI